MGYRALFFVRTRAQGIMQHICQQNRIKRHCCTFEGTDLVRKLTSPPRKYGRIMQPICKQNGVENELSAILFANVHFLLYLCSAK